MATSFLPSPEPTIMHGGNAYETYPQPAREPVTASGSPCSECSLYCTIFQSMSYDCCREIRSCDTCANRFEHFHNHQHQPEYFPLNPSDGPCSHGPSHSKQQYNHDNIMYNENGFTHKLTHHPQAMNGFAQTTDVSEAINSGQPSTYSHSPLSTTQIDRFAINNRLIQAGPPHGLAVTSQAAGMRIITSNYGNSADIKEQTFMNGIKDTSNQIIENVSAKRRSQRNHRNQEGRKRNSEDLCQVCGDRASGYHYNALTCEGCKGFFRRSITNRAKYKCKMGGTCEMDTYTRRKCPDCRLKKCKSVGMLEECLLTEIQCQSKRRRKKMNKTIKTNGDLSPETRRGDSEVDYFAEKNLEIELQSMVQNVEESFQDYRINPEMVKQWENQHNSTSNKERCRLSDVATVHVQVLVEYAKKLPGFIDLDPEDQIALLKGSVMQAMLLRNSCGYNHLVEEPNVAKLRDETGTFKFEPPSSNKLYFLCHVLGIETKHLDALFDFFHAIRKLEIDSTQYALLIAVVIFDSGNAKNSSVVL